MADIAHDETEPAPTRIVVGIDGSDSSRTALAWAIRQAKLTGAPLRVLLAWQFPTDFGWGASLPPDIDFEGDARRVAETTVREVVATEGDDGLDLTVTVNEGHAAPLLVQESETAALAVVGSRGHGEFAGMLIGSVSEHLAAHAHCPVTIVR